MLAVDFSLVTRQIIGIGAAMLAVGFPFMTDEGTGPETLILENTCTRSGLI